MATTNELDVWRIRFNAKNRKERIEHIKSLFRPRRRFKTFLYGMIGGLYGQTPNATRSKAERSLDAFRELREDMHYLAGAALVLQGTEVSEADTLLLDSYLVLYDEKNTAGANTIRRFREQSEKILRFIEKLERKRKA